VGKLDIKMMPTSVEVKSAWEMDNRPAKDIVHLNTDLKNRSNGITKVQDRAIMNSPIAKVIQKTRQVGFRIFTVAIKMIQKSNSIAGI